MHGQQAYTRFRLTPAHVPIQRAGYARLRDSHSPRVNLAYICESQVYLK